MMRIFFIAVALSLAGAAEAQTLGLQSETELRTEQMMARQRSVALENELQSMDARLRTEQAVRNLEIQRGASTTGLYRGEATPKAPKAKSSTGGFASIPDDRLAASNARVREASRNR